MVARRVAGFVGIICCAAGLTSAQVVEKLSVSFSFPTTLTSVHGNGTDPKAVSFFRMAGHSVQKGKVTLEWSCAGSATEGTISIFSVSGALVKKVVLSARNGTTQVDLGKAAAGVYFAAISYGSYRQNLKLALYK
ncbi:MAG TPA: T9SS type A sorting domain-containing protein [Chitinivibrionales bacterium]|jgi:hypothetical protein|nr:T9SS type A sorting domain-containing protein [Chitinivibrionales bacterium]